MSCEKDLEAIDFLLDKITDECNLEGTVAHVRLLEALVDFRKEVNRKGLIGKDEPCHNSERSP